MSAENPYAGQGAVLLDIGGDAGALVVTMPRSMVGDEVEIRPWPTTAAPRLSRGHDHGHRHSQDHSHEHLAHVEVVERPVAGGLVPSLVFGGLEAGRYDLFEKGRPASVALTVDVAGGRVTSADWPV